MTDRWARQRVEPARVVDAYRRTGVGIIRADWGDVDGDGGRYACGLGVVLLVDELSTMNELCAGDMGPDGAAARLGVSVSYAEGFIAAFDGHAGVDATEPELRELFSLHPMIESDAAALAELRAGIADGVAALDAAEEAERRGELRQVFP